MAVYNVANAKHAMLSPGSIDTVNLVPPLEQVVVVNRGAQDIYFTVGDATGAVDPIVGGDSCFVVLGNSAYPMQDFGFLVSQVKLISTGAASYSVMAVA